MKKHIIIPKSEPEIMPFINIAFTEAKSCLQNRNRIVDLLKAKKINPNEPDLNYNLGLANLRVVDRIELPLRFFMFDWWDQLKWYFSIWLDI